MAKKIRLAKTKATTPKKRKRRVVKKNQPAKKIRIAKEEKGVQKKRVLKKKKRKRIVKQRFVETIKEIKSARFGRVVVKESIQGFGAVCRTADLTYSSRSAHDVSHVSWRFNKIAAGKYEIMVNEKVCGTVQAVRKNGARRWKLNDGKKSFSTKRIFALIVYHLYKLIEAREISIDTKWFAIGGPTVREFSGGKWKSCDNIPTNEK